MSLNCILFNDKICSFIKSLFTIFSQDGKCFLKIITTVSYGRKWKHINPFSKQHLNTIIPIRDLENVFSKTHPKNQSQK